MDGTEVLASPAALPLDKYPREPRRRPQSLANSAATPTIGGRQHSMEPPSPLSPTKPLSDEKRFSQARKPSQPLHATPSITLDPDAWVAYLVLSGISVTEDMNAICHNAVTAARKNFPGALPDQQVMNMVMRAMSAKVPNFSSDTTMLATSFCPDEIQNSLGDLSHLLLQHFGKNFDFAGLGGIPFAGKTGFKAFAHHVPKNHNVLVVYGPHVAISPSGDVGLYLRDGQEHLSPACGACIGALAHLDACKPVPEPGSEEYDLDFQMNFLKKELKSRMAKIHSHPNGKNVGLVREAFSIAQKLMHGMIDMNELDGGQLVLLGGVQINMPRPLPNFFMPLSFSIQSATQEPESLLSWFTEENLWTDDPVPPTPCSGSHAPMARKVSMRSMSWRRMSRVSGDILSSPARPHGPAPSSIAPLRVGARKATLPEAP